MIITGIKNNKIFKQFLPENPEGNYLIKDNYGTTIGNIIAENSNWVLYPNEDYILNFNNNQVESCIIENYNQVFIKNIIDGSISVIFTSPTVETNLIEVKPLISKITIGSDRNCDISYQTNLINQLHATITHEGNKWYLECANQCYVFVEERLAKRKRLSHGETIYLYGLKIICICDFIVLINTVKNNALNVKPGSFEQRKPINQEIKDNSFRLQSECEVFTQNDFFMRSPRFRTSVIHERIELAPPPDSQKQSVQPSILTVGPQLTMLLSSSMGMFVTLSNVAAGNQTLSASLPQLIITAVTMISALFWPSMTRKWNKRNQKRNELIRVRSYRKYLEKRIKK